MPKFVHEDRVAVSLENDPHIIWIRAKMDFGTRQKIYSAMAQITAGLGDQPQVGFDMGAYQMALLQHNILAWEGPDFKGVPCTPENIGHLDPDDPLVQKTADEIAARANGEAQVPPAGSSTSGAGGSEGSA